MKVEKFKTRITNDGSRETIVRYGHGQEFVEKTTETEPLPALIAAFHALAADVNEIAELGIDMPYIKDRIEVRGVSFKKDGIVITAIRNLDRSNSPLIINTPYKLLERTNPDDDAVSAKTAERVKHLYELVVGFINGETAQENLPFTDGNN